MDLDCFDHRFTPVTLVDTLGGKEEKSLLYFRMVPAEGLEPPHPSGQQILSLSRLPFRHAGMVLRP